MDTLYVLAQLGLLVFCIRIFSAYSPITIFVTIWLINYLMYLFSMERIIDLSSDFVKAWSAIPYNNYHNIDPIVGNVTLSQSLFVVIGGFVIRKKGNASTLEGGSNIHNINSTSDNPLKIGTGLYSLLASIALILLTILHALIVDWNVLWFNTTYLTIHDPERIGFSGPLLRVLHQGLIIIGLCSYLLFENYKKVYGIVRSAVILLPFVYTIVIYVAASSRSATVLIAAPLLYSIIYRKYLLMGFWLIMFGFVFTMCIIGRNESYLGISAIPHNATLALESIDTVFLGLLINSFQGCQVFAEALLLSRPEYTSDYKILSFSPFPAFIDGFTMFSQVRVNEYVPFNNISEAYYFGNYYLLVYFITLSIYCSIAHLAAKVANYAGRITVISLFVLTVMLMSSYPIRNCFRFELITSVVAMYIYRTQNRTRVQ